jgi:hypothetical protein
MYYSWPNLVTAMLAAGPFAILTATRVMRLQVGASSSFARGKSDLVKTLANFEELS